MSERKLQLFLYPNWDTAHTIQIRLLDRFGTVIKVKHYCEVRTTQYKYIHLIFSAFKPLVSRNKLNKHITVKFKTLAEANTEG